MLRREPLTRGLAANRNKAFVVVPLQCVLFRAKPAGLRSSIKRPLDPFERSCGGKLVEQHGAGVVTSRVLYNSSSVPVNIVPYKSKFSIVKGQSTTEWYVVRP
ncbi:hypothetical protein CORC01_12689 [Colletotrichum orchidophilum]|uniref:Uncharacterized protein n=1 Tax=Colletotrichum orchidophilum TaxID=1209926 RepID=A0A1G4AS59_9PEZI|nr:uncharacterized protein CORC01_12689 [Colletotrichum orchidophilum]OHE91998.1 hypothetical protein CORC01_12689 [Colletotrichum orchidophilum]